MHTIGDRIEQFNRRDVRLYEAARQRMWGRGRGDGKPLSPAARKDLIERRDRLGNRLYLARWALGYAECIGEAWERLSAHGPLPTWFGSSVAHDYPDDWREAIAFAYPNGIGR